MPVGPERNCRAKPSGIVLLTRRATAQSARIPGVRSDPHRATEISICGIGIQFLSGHFPRGPAISALPTLSEMGGNGRAHPSLHFQGSNHFLSILATPRTFSMHTIA